MALTVVTFSQLSFLLLNKDLLKYRVEAGTGDNDRSPPELGFLQEYFCIVGSLFFGLQNQSITLINKLIINN